MNLSDPEIKKTCGRCFVQFDWDLRDGEPPRYCDECYRELAAAGRSEAVPREESL